MTAGRSLTGVRIFVPRLGEVTLFSLQHFNKGWSRAQAVDTGLVKRQAVNLVKNALDLMLYSYGDQRLPNNYWLW